MTEQTSIDHYLPGRRFVSEPYLLDAEQIKLFAGQFDPQPFHLDDVAAANSPFGGLIASGWHTAAVSMRLLVGSGAFMSGGAIGAGADIKWLRPAHAGDLLTVITEVTSVKPSHSNPDRYVVTLHVVTRNQHDNIVQIMDAKIVVPSSEISISS